MEPPSWLLDDFCICFCGLVRVFTRAFKFELIALSGIAPAVPGIAPALFTGTAATTVIASPQAGRALQCSVTGVQSVS